MSLLNSTTHADLSAIAPDLELLAAIYLDVIPRAMREIRLELWSHRSLDMSVPQFRVLANLGGRVMSNKELAQAVGVSIGTMSRMVQYLADRGLIEKSVAPDDKRELSIQLSHMGVKVFESIRASAREGLAAKLRGLSPGKRKLLVDGLAVLSHHLNFESPRA